MIDGVSVRMPEQRGLSWTAAPALLPLFPDGNGRIVVELTVSSTFPAGRCDIPIELRSSVDEVTTVRERLSLVVPEQPNGVVTVEPPVRSGRRDARYTVRFDNTGNTALEVGFAASDPARAARATFVESSFPVSPGSTSTTPMRVRCKRRFFGGELSHQVTVLASAGELELDTKAVFRQRPMIPRGARTLVILGTILALWAAIFAIVLSRAMSKDPLTKQAPASFYASLPRKGSQAKLQSVGGSGSAVGLAAASSAAPAGAVPKSGVVIGVGGTISGKVEAKSTGAGLGRINVEALEEGPKGVTTVASAATASNGTYAIDGLLPGNYKILFEAQGFQQVFYPNAASAASAKTVTVDALATTTHVNAVIAGLPGTITGLVRTGESPSPPVTVTVQPQQGTTTPITSVKTNAQGAYTIRNLPTPGQYDLSFAAKGFQVASSTDQLRGGQALIADTVTLGASTGSIAGVVTAAGKPLGGVAITAQGGGQTFTSATPTTGAIGHFSLVGLPSPATYLLTFTDAGYGTRIIGEKLGPGQDLSNLGVALQGGAGGISGTVTSTAGTPLGGVTVTVEGGASPVSTQTFTAGTVGAYDLSGLATPGRYTLTFSLAGYESQTIAVPLASSGSAHGVDVRLPPAVGSIRGTITSTTGTPLSGVDVTATNGTKVTTTKSTSQPPGGFLLTGLAPGSYSVTFSVTGYAEQTYLVTLAPGASSSVQAQLAATG